MTYMDFAVEGRSDHQSKENFATWGMENGHDWGLGTFYEASITQYMWKGGLWQ